MFPEPEVLLEFPLIGEHEPIYKCTICGALLLKDDCQMHANWHANERMRNFGGF